MDYFDQQLVAQGLRRRLAAVLVELEDIEDDADSEGLLAISHKIVEGKGALLRAELAAKQYGDGSLAPRLD